MRLGAQGSQRRSICREGGVDGVNPPGRQTAVATVTASEVLTRAPFGAGNGVNVHFPSSNGSGQYDFGKTASISWWRRKIKFCVKVLGLDPTFYSGHSLRAGGATDLFVQRVPYYLIKRMGRWKSDAAMLYYRSEEDVRTAVARAFGEIGHVWKRGGGMNLKCGVYLGGVPCAEVKYLAP